MQFSLSRLADTVPPVTETTCPQGEKEHTREDLSKTTHHFYTSKGLRVRPKQGSCQTVYGRACEGLKRGPKPDPTREKCTRICSLALTDREFKAIEDFRRKLPTLSTRSQLLRYIVRRWMEDHTVLNVPGMVLRLGDRD